MHLYIEEGRGKRGRERKRQRQKDKLSSKSVLFIFEVQKENNVSLLARFHSNTYLLSENENVFKMNAYFTIVRET